MNRVAAGVPAGGQFASRTRPDALDIVLNPPTDVDWREPRPYAVIAGGLVQNNPTLPVLDIDVYDLAAEDAVDLRNSAAELGLADIVAEIDRKTGTSADSPGAIAIAKTTADPRSYIIIRGGLVQNDPSIPYFDLDNLEQTDPDDASEIAALVGHRDDATRIGAHHIAEQYDEWLIENDPTLSESGRIDDYDHDQTFEFHNRAIELGVTRAQAAAQARFDDIAEETP